MDAPFLCIGRILNGDWTSWTSEWMVACAYPRHRAFVCAPPPLHIAQTPELIAALNAKRAQEGKPPLTQAEEDAIYADQVDLFVRRGKVQIRPDEYNIENALLVDEMFQEVLKDKLAIEFLNTSYPAVRRAIKRRGELWRIVPEPHSDREIEKLIDESRVAIGERRIYYYNRITGTRYLTCSGFESLGVLTLEDLRRHLIEIAIYSDRRNSKGRPELALLGAANEKPLEMLRAADLSSLPPEKLRELHEAAHRVFVAGCGPVLRHDNPTDKGWKCSMARYLLETTERFLPEEVCLGLSPEFLLKVQWLPGGRIQDRAISLETDLGKYFPNPPAAKPEDRFNDAPDPHEQVRGIIMNFFRAYPDLEYINVGRVVSSLADREGEGGRRGVYLVEVKLKSSDTEIVRIVRLQKWDTWVRLNDPDKTWESAMAESAEYTDYVLDRRLGCQQLGMSVSSRIDYHSFPETYRGCRNAMYGVRIWSVFFVRDYVKGVVTSKIPAHRLREPGYGKVLGRLLGEAAAVNMIVGRASTKGRPWFDDGDEVVNLDEADWPVSITVADPTGAFSEYRGDLLHVTPAYAKPYVDRWEKLHCPSEFLEAYLEGFVKRFEEVQCDYLRRKSALQGLFAHQPKNPKGSFAYRWDCVLDRLERSDARAIAAAIRSAAEQGVAALRAKQP